MALRFVQPMRRHLLVALLACDAARGAVKDLGACVRLAERRKAEPHSEYLEKKWASLECHLMPSTPTQVFRANPNLGATDRMEMLERNGQKVPRFILQQECDEHQRELIKHDCLLQRFTHAGDFGGEGNQAYHPAAELAEKFRIARGKGKGTKRSALEAEVATGRVDRCTGGPLLGLDPNKRYMVFPGAHMTKDALGRHTISYA